MEDKILAGFASVDVTPPMGQNIPGYYHARYADGIETSLLLRAAAFACGETKLVMFNCECVGIRASAFEIIKKKVADRCGISEDAIYINCVHSHTSFRIYDADVSEEMTDLNIFLLRLYQQFADCAQFAFEDLKPCTLEMAMGKGIGLGFMRKYRMADGSAKTNPPLRDPNIVAPIGTPDPDVPLIRVRREDAEEILIIGYGAHADMIGGTKYTPDWPGYVVRLLDKALDGVHTMFFLGPEGDVGTRNAIDPDKGVPGAKGVGRAKALARRLAAEVLRVYDTAQPVVSESIAYAHKYVQVGKNSYDPAQLPMVEELVKIYREKGEKAPELSKYPNLHYREALRINANLSRPEFFNLRISGIRLGEIAFVGIPGEPFACIGMDIKAASPIARTVVTACTNGHEGYYPDAASYDEPGYSYERATSPFASDCSKILIQGALDVLNQLA